MGKIGYLGIPPFILSFLVFLYEVMTFDIGIVRPYVLLIKTLIYDETLATFLAFILPMIIGTILVILGLKGEEEVFPC